MPSGGNKWKVDNPSYSPDLSRCFKVDEQGMMPKGQPGYWEIKEKGKVRVSGNVFWGLNHELCTLVPRRGNLEGWFWAETLDPDCLGFISLHHLFALWSQTGHLTSLSPSSQICKMGENISIYFKELGVLNEFMCKALRMVFGTTYLLKRGLL